MTPRKQPAPANIPGVTLAEFLGLPLENLASFDVRVDPRQPLVVRAEYHIFNPNTRDFDVSVKRFVLVSEDDPRLLTPPCSRVAAPSNALNASTDSSIEA